MASSLKTITDDTFEAEVIKSSTPFLLDLTAEWCQPCKAMAVVVGEVAAEYAGRVAFGSVDIDKNPKIPTRFHVMSIPTLLLFQGGKVVGQLTGAHPKARIVALLSKTL
jgi:thioredoxin 1